MTTDRPPLPPQLIAALNVNQNHTTTALGGNANENYLLADGERNIVVKRIKEHTAENENLEAIYRKRLSDEGLPVSSFYEFGGNSFVFNYGSQDYVATDYIEGNTVDSMDIATLKPLAIMLAKIHNLPTTDMPARLNWFNKNYLTTNLDEISDEHEAKGYFANIASNLPCLWTDNIPKGIVHGDLHGGNIIIDKSENIASIIDWEETGVEPLILDFAGVLRFFAFSSKDGWDMEYARAFTESYESERHITDSEKEVLGDALKHSLDIEGAWAHIKHTNGQFNDEQFKKFSTRHTTKITTPDLWADKR